MDLRGFCARLARVDGLDSLTKSLALLWWLGRDAQGATASASGLARLMRDNALGNPNPTRLAARLRSSRLTLKANGGFRLRAGAEDEILPMIAEALDGAIAQVPPGSAFVPEAVWGHTRGYIEKVCWQLNGSYHYGFYDAASVMLRRLIETLVIEAYEHLGREAEIRGADGNYLMLGDLVDRAVAPGGLPISRETKKALKDVKALGDRSAHSRRFNAVQADMDKVRDGVRVAVEDLVNLASLRRATRP